MLGASRLAAVSHHNTSTWNWPLHHSRTSWSSSLIKVGTGMPSSCIMVYINVLLGMEIPIITRASSDSLEGVWFYSKTAWLLQCHVYVYISILESIARITIKTHTHTKPTYTRNKWRMQEGCMWHRPSPIHFETQQAARQLPRPKAPDFQTSWFDECWENLSFKTSMDKNR